MAAVVAAGCVAADPGTAGGNALRAGPAGAVDPHPAPAAAPPLRSTTPAAAAAGAASLRGAPPDDGGASRAALQALLRDECRSDADCATLGLGRRPCGGPERYVAFSTGASDVPAVKAAAARHEAARDRFNDASGRGVASTCEVVVDPGAMCQVPAASAAAAAPTAGRCVTRRPPARSPATR